MTFHNLKRNFGLDFIAGIFIIHMIWLHILQLTKVDMQSPLYQSTQYLFFFMPWFFYKSGMFYKTVSNKIILQGGGKRLIKPLLIFSMIGYLLDVGSHYLKGTMSINSIIVEPLSYFAHYGCVNGNAPLWFLTNLFCARFIYNLFQRKILVALLALVMAIVLHYMGWNYPLNLGGLMAGLFFYALGDLLRSRQYGIWQLIVSALLFALSIMIGIQRVSIFRNSLEQGEYYVLFFIQSTAAIIMVNNLVNRLQLRETNIFCLIGRDSIGFYVSHWPVLLIILSLLKQMGEFSQSQTILLIVVLLVMILPIVNSTIKRLKLI